MSMAKASCPINFEGTHNLKEVSEEAQDLILGLTKINT